MVFNSLPSVTQELNNFFHQINKLTRFARSFVYFCEKNYLIPSLLRVRELKTICFFPSVSNDTFIYRLCSEVEEFNILVLLWSIGVKWSVGVKSFHTYAPFHTYVSFGLKNPKKIFHRPGGESNPSLLGDRWESLPLYHGSLPDKQDIYSLLYT